MGPVTEFVRSDLVGFVAKTAKLPWGQAETAIVAALDGIQQMMVGGSSGGEGAKLTLRGFGVFETRRTPEKNGNNFQTGEPCKIPAGRRISFAPSKKFKQAVRDIA